MPVSYRIFRERGLVYVKYSGHAVVSETMTAFEAYAKDPDCAPGQKQLVDLSEVKGMEANYVEILKLQARKADVFAATGVETLVVYYAPTDVSMSLARLVERSWQDFDAVVPIIQQNEANALELLGQPERSMAELSQKFA